MVAAALLPSPARIGMSVRTSTSSPGGVPPNRSIASRQARSIRFSPTSGGPPTKRQVNTPGAEFDIWVDDIEFTGCP